LKEDENSLRRFLVGRKLDVDAALERLQQMVQWRSETFPVDQSFIETEVAAAKAAVHGEDRGAHPVLYVYARRHDANTRDVLQCTSFVAFMVENAVQALRPPSSKISVVFDLRDLGMAQADYKMIKRMIYILDRFYPERAHRIYVTRAPAFFETLWVWIQTLLDPVTAEKIEFIDTMEKLEAQVVAEENMPEPMKVELEDERKNGVATWSIF
jgi:hypothetical protein